MMIKVSSAYWMTGKSEEELTGIGRLMRPLCLALLRMDWSRLAARKKKEWGKGIPLPKSSFTVNVLPRDSIKQNFRDPRLEDILNPRDPSVGKTFGSEDFEDGGMLNFIKGFFKVKFENYNFLF